MMKYILYIVMSLIAVGTVMADINCSTLTTDITIDIDPEPYISATIDFFATLPNQYRSQELECWSYVRSEVEDEYIQVNPEKTIYSITFIPIFRKKQETREYFTSRNGVVNAYITYDKLVAYTQFVVGVKCVDSNGADIIGEKCITPYYKEMKSAGTRAMWTLENADMLIILFIVVLIIIIFVGLYYRKIFK